MGTEKAFRDHFDRCHPGLDPRVPRLRYAKCKMQEKHTSNMQFAIQYDMQYNMQSAISKNSTSDTKILYISEEEEDDEEEEENSEEEEEISEEAEVKAQQEDPHPLDDDLEDPHPLDDDLEDPHPLDDDLEELQEVTSKKDDVGAHDNDPTAAPSSPDMFASSHERYNKL